MDREIIKRPTPMRYQQPGEYFAEWVLKDTLEEVDYIPQTHLRIWYNNDQGVYSPHHHNAMEIILCIENQCVVQVNGTDYRLNVGDALFVPPDMLHKLIFDEFGVRFIFLVDVDILKNYQDFRTLGPVFVNPFLCMASTQPQIYRAIYSSLMRMTEIYFENNTFWEARIYSHLLETMALIGEASTSSGAPGNYALSESKQWEYFEKFTALLSYIDANYNHELTLDQAARHVGFSKYHFARLFKIHLNTTFHNYLCHKRIQVAQTLLSTDMSVTDIASQVGFNNTTSFCRCFKKIANCSPTEYRIRLYKSD